MGGMFTVKAIPATCLSSRSATYIKRAVITVRGDPDACTLYNLQGKGTQKEKFK